jgi:hypothetical protein
MVADLCQLQFVVFSFFEAKRRQNDNYRLFAPKRRQNDKSTKLRRKDDKHNPLISNLICRLLAWRFVVFSPRKDDRTTKHQNDKCRVFAPKRRQNKKLTIRQNALSDKYNPLICRLFAWRFVVLSTFRFVVFSGRKDDNYRSFWRFVVFSRRKDDKLGR